MQKDFHVLVEFTVSAADVDEASRIVEHDLQKLFDENENVLFELISVNEAQTVKL